MTRLFYFQIKIYLQQTHLKMRKYVNKLIYEKTYYHRLVFLFSLVAYLWDCFPSCLSHSVVFFQVVLVCQFHLINNVLNTFGWNRLKCLYCIWTKLPKEFTNLSAEESLVYSFSRCNFHSEQYQYSWWKLFIVIFRYIYSSVVRIV